MKFDPHSTNNNTHCGSHEWRYIRIY